MVTSHAGGSQWQRKTESTIEADNILIIVMRHSCCHFFQLFGKYAIIDQLIPHHIDNHPICRIWEYVLILTCSQH